MSPVRDKKIMYIKQITKGSTIQNKFYIISLIAETHSVSCL